MEKRLTMFLAAMFLMIGTALAQTKVNGTVTSQEDGQPVIGASVLVVGTQIGTVTDMNGRFSLTVPAGKSMLRITYVGMEPIEVSARPNMKIVLTGDQKALDEVIVVAYGTQKKSSFTGSAATMKAEKIEKLQVSNLSKALEGAVAGVQSFSSSGTPGSGATIMVRGIGSISGSKTPLIVVDGVPYEGSLNSLNSHDIESMTVLKDAAANSMYGARGANGVIMITTKNASVGKPKINFEGRIGFNARAIKDYDIISDAGEYYEMFWEAMRNSKIEEMGMAAANQWASNNLIETLRYNKFKGIADTELIDPMTGKLNKNATQYKWGDDWTKDPFNNGLRQEYNVNISAGSESTKVYASLGYLGDEGYIVGSDFKRYSARIKLDQNIGKYIRIGGNISYANTIQKQFNGSVSTNFSNIFMFAQSIAPIYPIYQYDAEGKRLYDENGDSLYDFGEERPYGSNQNPLAVAERNQVVTTRDNITTRGFFEYSFLKDFKFTFNIAYDLFNTFYSEYNTPIGGDAKNVGGRGEKETQRYAALNANQLLDWNHEFGKHGVHVLLGHETKNDRTKYMYGHMTNFADPNNPEFSNAAQYQDLTSYTSEYALEGYFAKAEYDYADRYYFTTSIRRDGSSRFHKDNRWGTFWSIGGAWRIKEESFMKDVRWLDNLKLKISYGTQGNDNVGYAHNYTDLYRVDRVSGAAAFTKVNRGNSDLTWEKSRNFNVGFEAGFWRRLNINFDFFIKETKDLLYASPLATSEGSPTYIYRNEMDMKNTGIEMEINGDIIKTKDIRWNAALNFTHYKNELTRLPNSKPADLYPNGYAAGDYWRKLGGSLYDFYYYEYVGVDPTNGKPQYNHYTYETNEDGTVKRDANGDEIIKSIEKVNSITEATQRQTGKSAIPSLTGGFSTTLEAYGFDLSIQTAFQLGGYVFDSYYNSLMTAGSNGHNFHKDMFDRWTPAHTDTTIPALGFDVQDAGISGNSDYYLTKASYFNLRNITLGYTLPTKIVSKWGIERLRFYLTGDNVWLQSKRRGLDPRQGYDGSTGYVYSALSSYSFGVSLSF